MRTSLPLFFCLLVSVSANNLTKEQPEGAEEKEESDGRGGCIAVPTTEGPSDLVCAEALQESCSTQYTEECREAPVTRQEVECEEGVVEEPVETCLPGEAHQVCHTSMVESVTEECSTTFHLRCPRAPRRSKRGILQSILLSAALTPGAASPGLSRSKRGVLQKLLLGSALSQQTFDIGLEIPRKPSCARVPRTTCTHQPLSTPTEVCHIHHDQPTCSTAMVERTEETCRDVEATEIETICHQVSHETCIGHGYLKAPLGSEEAKIVDEERAVEEDALEEERAVEEENKLDDFWDTVEIVEDSEEEVMEEDMPLPPLPQE